MCEHGLIGACVVCDGVGTDPKPKNQADYICGMCGKGFSRPVAISYREYPGASLQKDFVSPCCRSSYGENE